MFKELSWDGCNGDILGKAINFEEAVQYLLLSEYGWTEKKARASLKRAQKRNELLIVDYDGEGFIRLIPV